MTREEAKQIAVARLQCSNDLQRAAVYAVSISVDKRMFMDAAEDAYREATNEVREGTEYLLQESSRVEAPNTRGTQRGG